MKISILMPTYNDSASIAQALDSVLNQTYENYEIIVINDGSTDNTESVIDGYRQKNQAEIKYIYQSNQDQLNALINAVDLISGDLVFVLHSDDLLPSDYFFEKVVEYYQQNPDTEAVIGALEIIDEHDNVVNRWNAGKFWFNKKTAARLLLNDGCNIYGDVTVQRVDVFKDRTFRNYLTWNTPFWLDMESKVSLTRVKNVNFPLLKYRIHGDNYVNNAVGKFNALNGELRVIVQLSKYYDLPLIGLQRRFYQFLRQPIIRKLKLFNYYRPIVKFSQMPQKKISYLLKKAIYKTYGDSEYNQYLQALIKFYETTSDRQIIIDFDNEVIFKGKDVRLFTKNLFVGELEELYYKIFDEMKEGFSVIKTNDLQKAQDLCKFLNINPRIKQKEGE